MGAPVAVWRGREPGLWVAVGVGDEDVSYLLAGDGGENGRQVVVILGAGIDDRDLSPADDVGTRPLEREAARVVTHHPADKGCHFRGLTVAGFEVCDVRNGHRCGFGSCAAWHIVARVGASGATSSGSLGAGCGDERREVERRAVQVALSEGTAELLEDLQLGAALDPFGDHLEPIGLGQLEDGHGQRLVGPVGVHNRTDRRIRARA